MNQNAAALKARFNPSAPHNQGNIVEIDAVVAQQVAVFFLKYAIAMVRWCSKCI
jgi:hypothetical protein